MSRAVVFAPEAQNDLIDLYDYIADHRSPTRALGDLNRIEKACMSLKSLPERGTRRDDLRPGMRLLGFERRVMIAFRVSPDSVAILRILNGGRNVELAFPDEHN